MSAGADVKCEYEGKYLGKRKTLAQWFRQTVVVGPMFY